MEAFKRYAVFAPAVVAYFTMRISVLGGFLGEYENGEEFVRPLIDRFFLSVLVFIEYIKELVYPHPLQIFYEFPAGSNIFTISFLSSLIGIILLSIALYFFIRKKASHAAFAFIWILLFYIPILMLSQIAVRNYFSERYLLGASIGIALLVAFVLTYIWGGDGIIKGKLLSIRGRVLPFSGMFSDRYAREEYLFLLLVLC